MGRGALARQARGGDRSPARWCARWLSWHQRAVVDTDRIETIADAVARRCPIAEALDDLLVVLGVVMLVREDSIKVGMRMLDEHAGLVVEPSAALGIAAILEEPDRFAGRRVTTILCGSNLGPADFARRCWNPSHPSAARRHDGAYNRCAAANQPNIPEDAQLDMSAAAIVCSTGVNTPFMRACAKASIAGSDPASSVDQMIASPSDVEVASLSPDGLNTAVLNVGPLSSVISVS